MTWTSKKIAQWKSYIQYSFEDMQQNLHVTKLTLLRSIYTQDIALSRAHTHTNTVSYKLSVLYEIQTLRARFYGIVATSTNTALSFSFITMLMRTNGRWNDNITD